MGTLTLKKFAIAALAATTLAAPVAAAAPPAQRAIPRNDPSWRGGVSNEAFDRGYREGLRAGEDDARRNRAFNVRNDRAYRNADSGYDRRDGDRRIYQDTFRRGFSDGYSTGYNRGRGTWTRPGNPRVGVGNGRPGAGGRQDPAFARGYSDGYHKGFDDGEDRDRRDPTRHGDYRSADQGYRDEYGRKDAYRDTYRRGFTDGYDDGYRDGDRRR
jgi:flagellar biosynthesis/type III secretory pathway protein FliH